MPVISSEETVLSVSAANNEPLDLRVEAGVPVAVRVEVHGSCTCHGGTARRPGSYIDMDYGK